MKATTEKHLLMLVHRIPYPPDKGDKIRSFHEFCFLQKKGWHIHLCTFVDDINDLPHTETLRSQCITSSFHRLNNINQKTSMALALCQRKPLSVGAFYNHRAQQYVNKVLSDYPVRAVLCFSSSMAEYIFRSKLKEKSPKPKVEDPPSVWRAQSGQELACSDQSSAKSYQLRAISRQAKPRLIMDLIDVDSDKWQQYAGQSGKLRSWIYMLESRRLALYEKQIVDAFDATTVVSEAEADLLRKRTGGGEKIHAVPNGVDTVYFHPASKQIADKNRKPCCTLIFCGLMDYYPNVDAVVWFAKEVLPRVRKRIGEVQFNVVGAKPAKEILKLTDNPDVKVLGRVEDVRPHVRQADISIAPIRIARGIQNKVLEAMAMAKPVVATEQAFEGIEAVPGRDLLVTKAEPDAYAEAIATLWEQPVLAEDLGKNARQVVENSYDWNARLEKLHALLFLKKL